MIIISSPSKLDLGNSYHPSRYFGPWFLALCPDVGIGKNMASAVDFIPNENEMLQNVYFESSYISSIV
jgi:hypothetical protein